MKPPLYVQAYRKAIEKAVQKVKEEDGEVHALDLGCGAGVFAMLAAKAGATSVVACDMHEPLCVATRKVEPSPALTQSHTSCRSLTNSSHA